MLQAVLLKIMGSALVRDVVFGGVEHLAWKVLCGQGILDVERLADDLTDLVLVGIERRPEPAVADNQETARLREQIDRLEELHGRLTGTPGLGAHQQSP